MTLYPVLVDDDSRLLDAVLDRVRRVTIALLDSTERKELDDVLREVVAETLRPLCADCGVLLADSQPVLPGRAKLFCHWCLQSQMADGIIEEPEF